MRVAAPETVREAIDLDFLARASAARTSLDVDLGELRWVSPLGIVALLATCLSRRDREIRVTLPRDPGVRRYLHQVGFAGELLREGWVHDGADTEVVPPDLKVCLPVTRLWTEFEVERAANALTEALNGRVAANLIDVVHRVAWELTNNAREHGSPCYVVVQPYTGRTSGTPGLFMAVADFGKGFARTLRHTLGRRLPDDEAIRKGFEEGVSGTADPHRGLGLRFVQQDVDAYDAQLTILSRRGFVTRERGVFHAELRARDFRGTVASVYFPHVLVNPPTAATSEDKA